MERAWFIGYAACAAFCVAGSALSRFAHLDPGPIAPIASVVTILVGAAVLWICLARIGVFEIQMLAVGALGVVAEVVGLATGWPFGRYRYTDAWAPTVGLGGLGPFPILLPIAWTMIVASAWSLVACVREIPSRWVNAAVVGLIATLADALMEPIAVGRLHYWRWLDAGQLPGGAPILNAVGWFAVSFLGAALLGPPKTTDPETRYAAAVLPVHLGMLALIGLLR